MNLATLPATSPFSSTGTAGLGDGLIDSDAAPASGPSFGQMLQGALGQANTLQEHSNQMSQAFAQGKISDVHSVMIASEQATVALQLTAQIRNKAVDAYQEIMRISM